MLLGIQRKVWSVFFTATLVLPTWVLPVKVDTIEPMFVCKGNGTFNKLCTVLFRACHLTEKILCAFVKIEIPSSNRNKCLQLWIRFLL